MNISTYSKCKIVVFISQDNDHVYGPVFCFVQAVDEPNFSEAYANMCKVLSNMRVQGDTSKDEPEYTFRKLLVNRCQIEFEKNSVVELDREAKLTEIEQITDPVSIYTECKQVCYVN